MTNICAAIGLAQLEQADIFIGKKRQVKEWYDDGLKKTPVITHREIGDVKHSYWMYSILTSKTTDRDLVREALANAGIETRPLFYPVHTMPMYSQKFQKHPVAENIGWRGLNLPSWPGLEKKQVDYICEIIRDFYNA